MINVPASDTSHSTEPPEKVGWVFGLVLFGFNFFVPYLSFPHFKKQQEDVEKRKGRHFSLGETSIGRREEREELNGKVTFQASSRHVF